ncbi:glycosyltransferase family 4 protein [Candidatus Omnitrophota bacterium]
MKVLFLVPYPSEGASNRIRVEQFISYLEGKGVSCKVRPFVNSRFFRILYEPHRFLEKIFWFIAATLNRALDIIRALSSDIVVIHREAYPFGGPFFESLLHKMGKPFVFDFDDAIFLANTSEHNIYIERFKKPEKVSRIIRMASWVIAGNDYLKSYAERFNKRVTVIPSSIDTDRYAPAAGRDEPKDSIVIGWIGSNTTRVFLYELEETFRDLFRKYENVKLKVVGARFYSERLKSVINEEWSLERELKALRSFDIGIMPMPDNEWTRGKCGFKAILYMACGIPVVASSVGVNAKIVEEGVTGFLVKDKAGWRNRLSLLIEDGQLRRRMGEKGRKRIVNSYSVGLTASIFYDTLNKIKGLKKKS